MLTISETICWTPIVTYFTLVLYVSYDMDAFYKVAVILNYLEAVLDPFYIVITISELRQELRRMFYG